MPTYQTGNMWTAYNEADLFLITTNATIKANGALVMGRGIARQARDKFQGLDHAIGHQIATQCGTLGRYGLLISPRWPQAKVGCFQVKYHWRGQADLALIEYSTQLLIQWAIAHPVAKIHLNMPGIGNGKLGRNTVLPIVATLPANITLWEYAAP